MRRYQTRTAFALNRSRPWITGLLLGLALVMLAVGCTGRSAAPATLPAAVNTAATAPAEPAPTKTAPAVSAPAASAPAGTVPAAPTAAVTPAAASAPAADAQAVEQPAPTRPPSGWTIFSNPNYVEGIAVHGGQVWAATRGGVVAWDLKSNQPTLYTTRDGLAEIQGSDLVYCPMPEDRILVAHPSGVISAYDLSLKKWSRMPVTFADGSTLHGVRALKCDPENRRLIVGGSDGLGILDERTGRWRRIGTAEGLTARTIDAIDVAGQSIWVAAGEKSAFLIMGSTVFPFTAASGFPTGSVNDISVAPDASVWMGYSTGLVHYHDKKWNSYGAQRPAGIPFLTVDHLEVGPDKRIWIASSEEGVCPFDTVELFCSTVYPVSRGAPITDLAVDTDGTAYAATEGGGVLVLGSDQVRSLVFQDRQLVSNDVMDIAESADGRVWIATDHGINVFDPGQPEEAWKVITQARNQLLFSRVKRLLPAADGMWFLYNDEPQASFYDGKTWLHLDALKGLSGDVLDAATDQRGYTWFAGSDGLKIWDGALIRAYTPPADFPGSTFRALYHDGDAMWVGTNRGLLLYQRFQWQVVLPEIAVNAIARDSAASNAAARDAGGKILLGTDQGLVRFDGSQSFLWVINLGSEIYTNPKVTSIDWDARGQLWVGTDGNGLFKFDGHGWEQFNTTNGLPTNAIRRIFTDHLGEVWIATTTGQGGGALVRYIP